MSLKLHILQVVQSERKRPWWSVRRSTQSQVRLVLMHAVNGQCLTQACLQVADVVLSIYHLALVCRLESLYLRHPVFQVPSTETSSASNTSAAGESGSATSSEPSPNGQQGRARISQAEAGLTLDSSAIAEAMQFQAEVISSIDKVRLSDHKPPCPLSLQPELLPLLSLNIWTVYLYAIYGPSSSDAVDFNDQDAAVILVKSAASAMAAGGSD